MSLERKSQNIVAFGEERYLTSLWTSSMGKAFKAFYWQAGMISDLFPATSAGWINFPSWTTPSTIFLTPT